MNRNKFFKREIALKHAVPKFGYALFAPTSIIATAISISPASGQSSAIYRFTVSTFSYLFFILVIKSLAAIFTKLPEHKSGMSISKLIVIGAMAGTLKGLGTSIFVEGSISISQILDRTASAGLLGTLTAPTLAFLAAEIAEIRNQVSLRTNDLVQQQTRNTKSKDTESKHRSERTAQITDEISNQILQAVNHLESTITTNAGMRDLVYSLIAQQKLATTKLAKINHPEIQAPRISNLKFANLALSNFIVPGWLGALIATPSALAFLSLQQKQQDLVFQLVIIAVSTFIGFELIHRLVQTQPSKAIVIWLIGTAGITITPFAINYLLNQQSLWSSPGVIAIFFAWLAVINLLGSALRAFVFQPDLVESHLIEQISEEAILQIAEEVLEFSAAQYMANFIHGRIQSRLMASLLLMDSSSFTKDDLHGELKELHALVTGLENQTNQTSAQTLEEKLTEIVNTWHGLLDVHGAELLPKQLLSNEVLSVIEEALLNSSRHGKAENVWLTSSDNRHITISDDGRGPQSGPRGLGSSIYDRAAKSWTLVASPDGIGSTLKLELRNNPPKTL